MTSSRQANNLTVGSDLLQWMKGVRRNLHRHPELSFEEYKTSLFIQEQLNRIGIPFQDGWAKTGVVARLGNGGADTPHVALRADMDALPVQEKNRTEYASEVPGVMHACGHDGHVAMLLGAAALLKEHRCSGRISCIFQPAEENGNGAGKMVSQGVLNDGIQAIFAGHIDTHYPTGVITVDEGLICSYADPFSIHLVGQSGHAARPHEAKDTIVAGACLVSELQSIVSREIDPNMSGVITVGKFQAGNAHNVIAEEALIGGTIRSNHPEARERLLNGLRRRVDGVARSFQINAELEFHDCLPAVINSSVATTVAREAAIRLVGGDRVISQGKPSLGGEDFAFYQQQIEGCLVRFGADSLSENSPTHSCTFDFDEDALAIGAGWLAGVADTWLRTGGAH